MVGAQRQRWFNAESVLLNPEKGSTVGERLQRFELFLILLTQGCRCAPTIGLKLANAFGVKLKLLQSMATGAQISQRLQR